MRNLISLLASLLLVLNLVSCTSNDSKDDELMGDEAVAEESTEGTDGDLENLDQPADSVASTDGANEGFLDEQLPEDALGESAAPPADTTVADSGGGDLSLEEPAPPTDVAPADTASMEPAPPIETPADSTVETVDTSTPPPITEDTTSSASVAGLTEDTSSAPPVEEPPPAPKPKVSLKKVKDAPFNQGKQLLNAVYVARPDDSYKKIATMIYGDASKQKDLKKANPTIKKPRPGDKIYYNSPVRPTDDTKLLTYYEDAGMMPEVYVAKEGDNLRDVAKGLLGYDNAWKEIWVTNAVDSKDTLAAGTELRYWKSAPVAAPPPVTEAPRTEVAANELPPPTMDQPPMPELPPPPAEMAPPPPPPADVAMNELPPPPPPAEMAPPPPPAPDLPPPPPAEAMNPPPPPPVAKKTAPAMTEGGMDQDMMMSLAGAGIIAAGLAAIIIIRKRRQNRDMATAFNDTQVGT